MLQSSTSLVWKRGMRRGWTSLLRQRGWAATLGALWGIFFLAQVLLFLTIGVRSVESLLRSQTDLRLEVTADATDQQVHDFYSAVHALPYVDDAQYITKEQAYEDERARDPQLIAFLDQYKLKNPFSDTIAVRLRQLSDYDSFASFIRNPQWQAVVDPSFLSKATDQEAQVRQLIGAAQSARLFSLFLLLLVLLVTALVVASLVRSRAQDRREEMLVERLVGADQIAVLLPFTTEATLLLFGAFLLSVVSMMVLLSFLPVLLPALGPGGAFSLLRGEILRGLSALVPIFLPLEILLLPLLAWVGAKFGLRSITLASL